MEMFLHWAIWWSFTTLSFHQNFILLCSTIVRYFCTRQPFSREQILTCLILSEIVCVSRYYFDNSIWPGQFFLWWLDKSFSSNLRKYYRYSSLSYTSQCNNGIDSLQTICSHIQIGNTDSFDTDGHHAITFATVSTKWCWF